MAQNLALPLNKCVIQTGYKDEAPGYSHLGAGQRHYGTDMTSAAGITTVYASCNGIVKGINRNNPNETVGLWVIIQYDTVIGFNQPLIVRYFHLESVDSNLNVGNRVTLDTVIGKYGKTGGAGVNTGKHLHVEVDTDLNAWNYTPTIASASGGLRPGNRDTINSNGDVVSQETYTRNPLKVFKRKISAPENQTFSLALLHDETDAWYLNDVHTPETFT